MSRVLVLNKSARSSSGFRLQRNQNYAIGASCVLNRKISTTKNRAFESGSAQLNLVSIAFVLIISICICGASYLYQVNSVVTKGYEVRELENKIQDLSMEKKKMEIREIELRSMYNIEKSLQDIGLVNSNEIVYAEINKSVAMR